MSKPTDLAATDYRTADAPILDIILHRWSPRAMSGEKLTAGERRSLFEAARWAPSCFNSQPWRFLYAETDSDDWATYFELLADGNKRWAERAAMLIVLCARTRLEHNDAATDTFGFDVGAAWQNLALQGTSMGLVVHGMRGFDKNAAREVLEIPELFSIEAMIAVGRPGEISELPESNQAKEMPSGRKSIDEFSAAGKFRFE